MIEIIEGGQTVGRIDIEGESGIYEGRNDLVYSLIESVETGVSDTVNNDDEDTSYGNLLPPSKSLKLEGGNLERYVVDNLEMIGIEYRRTSEKEKPDIQVIELETPEGVPPNANSLGPDEEVPEGAEVVQGPQGGRYYYYPSEDPQQPAEESEYVEAIPNSLDEMEEVEGMNFATLQEGMGVNWMDNDSFEDRFGIVTEINEEEGVITALTEEGEVTLQTWLDQGKIPGIEPKDRDWSGRRPDREEEETDEEPQASWSYDEDIQDQYGTIESVSDSDRLYVNGDLSEVEVRDDGLYIDRPSYPEPEKVEVRDGVLTRVQEDNRVQEGNIGYYTFSEDASADSGWYKVDEVEFGDEVTATFEGPDGEEREVNVLDIEERGIPVRTEEIDPSMESPWRSYTDEYPESKSVDGVEYDTEGLSEDQNTTLNRGLSKAYELDLIDIVERVDTFEKGSRGFESSAMARFKPHERELVFDPNDFTEEAIDSLSEGFMVGDRPEDIVIHESMHAFHAESLIEEGLDEDEIIQDYLNSELDDGEKSIIEEEVSVYGTSNPLEIVAEVGTKILKGEEVSDEVLHIYERYGGPEL